MDKQILSDYIDACELVKETEKDILRLNQKKKTIIQEKVKGSMHEFPYTEQNFKIQGSAYSTEDDDCLRREEDLLKKRKSNAEWIKVQVEEWMLTIPMRMQRIIRYKFFEGISWEKVAEKMGKNVNENSIKKEFERFFIKN